MFNAHDNGACAAATPSPTTQPAYEFSQPRLKCGEVFVWDCVGELFAIECQLCEERPICTLSEFAEHMDIWHYDWTAEAYASLPDSTTQERCGTWTTQWTAMEEQTDSASEVEHFGSEAEIDAEIQDTFMEAAALATTISDSSENVAISVACDNNSSSFAPFEVMARASTAVRLIDSGVASNLCAEEKTLRGAEDMYVKCASASTMTADVQKQVENPARQRSKTEKLIEIYEKYPELWRKQQRSELKPEEQAEAYRSISLELKQHGINLGAAAVKHRLAVLRKRYRLEKLEELRSMLEGRSSERCFEFYAHLSFLKEHIEPQFCGICKRICKDATECCKSSEQETGSIDSGTIEESGEKMEYCLLPKQLNGNELQKENVVGTDDVNGFTQCVSSADGVSAEIIDNQVDVNSTASESQHCGGDLAAETSIASEPATAQSETKSFKQKNALSKRRNAEYDSNVEKRVLRRRNEGGKVEILEVIELQPVFNLNTQEPEVSTSTVDASAVETMPKNNATTVADESVASEEYDSSNGDSGILQDCDERNEAGATENTEKAKGESFARLTTEQTRKLIQLYAEHPILWNSSHRDFNARERRRNAWRRLTAQLNEHFQMHYTWTTVHRKVHDYVKYYRRERTRIESEGGSTRWCFYDDFAYLAPMLAEQANDPSKQLLSKQQNLKIIEVYAEHPQLWDINNAQFKRRRLRQGLFKSMSDKLRDAHNINISSLKLKQRIVEFRCTYRLEKERRFTSEEQGEIYTPRYEYYDLLKFLDPHVAPFVCEKCGAQYKKHTEIERHMWQEHNNKRRKAKAKRAPLTAPEKKAAALANVCHICGMSFTMRRNLRCHLQRHTNQRPHACTQCPKKFFDAATLRLHERSHTKIRPFICEQCGASYVSGSKLNQHIKRHSNKRDHACELCGKAFYSAFECDRHMRTHMNIREKVCTICGKDFSVGSSYYAHMLLHSDVKRYKCNMCCQQFAQFAGLYKHRKRYHPAEFVKERAEKMIERAAAGAGAGAGEGAGIEGEEENKDVA
ncbi:protein suppressor of hairy wing-like [Rhagoletis pomonella]|uniref:protein suppressor of hairy wing-like n=1 Tax=Rhagoletis pomonella TaxID=28610 RepID=UPI0017843C30|nr:protein suppressor of hairy wing-like [Rhagoletis pomonella]